MNQNELYHHGILGQKWGVRRYQNYDGTLKAAGRKRYSGETLFVSGSSKTQDPESEWYLKKLPKDVRKELKKSIRKGDTIIVGDAPGIDRQVQDFLNKKRYDRVEVYGPGKQVRYSANSKWKTNPIDDPDHPEGSKEWLAKKDQAMTDAATKGMAVVLANSDGTYGASATRRNVDRLLDQYKDVSVHTLLHIRGKYTSYNINESMSSSGKIAQEALSSNKVRDKEKWMKIAVKGWTAKDFDSLSEDVKQATVDFDQYMRRKSEKADAYGNENSNYSKWQKSHREKTDKPGDRERAILRDIGLPTTDENVKNMHQLLNGRYS